MIEIVGLLLGIEPWLVERELPAYHSANEFRTVIHQPLNASWDNVPLRDLLRSVGEAQRVSLLLDRRIDPTITVQLALVNQSVAEGLEKLAQPLELGVVSVGNVVYLSPAETANWVRTTVAQRDAELTGETSTIPEKRQFALLNRKTISWQGLTSPAEILEEIAGRFHLELQGVERVPYDLWGAGALPHATAAEALTLVLRQCELDFRWLPAGEGIDIIPFQIPKLIERQYQPRGRQTINELLQSCQSLLPPVQARIVEGSVSVQGRVEDHERVDQLVRPGATRDKPETNMPVPLSRRQFTLRVENVPVIAIMSELEKSGVVFEYEAEELRTANIDLTTLTSMDVKQVTAVEFLKTLFEPLGIVTSVDSLTVRLAPKSK